MAGYLKRLKPVSFFICLAGSLILFVGCAGNYKYITKGREAASRGDWEESVRTFKEAHDKYPDDIEIRLMMIKSKWKGSIVHMVKGNVLLDKGLFDEAISEFKKSIALNPDNKKAENLIKKAADYKKSDEFAVHGQKLLKDKKYKLAREAFQKAFKLNSTNRDAGEALTFFRKKEQNLPKYRLKLKSSKPVSLKFKKTPIINVFEVLTKIAGINFIFDKDLKETDVTLFMTDISFDRFIDVLLKTNDLAAKVVNDNTMIIYPDTPAKFKEYQELQIRTFFLANMTATKAISLLSKILKARDITANEKLNSVVIRGQREVIEIASKILEANDRLPAEVLLNVEILEVKRSKEKQLGFEYSESFTIGIGEKSEGTSVDSGLVGWISMADLEKLSNRELMISTPNATLNLLKLDTDTRILANPQIRVKDEGKASILIGERIPLRVNRRVDSSTGDVTSDYQYHDVGVKLEVEPKINMRGEITMKLHLDVSSLGPNVGTVDDPQYSIRTRTAKSVLTVLDGEEVIFGGLISDEERKTVRSVPLLGAIPVIGHLFSNIDSRGGKTDILMVIKPVIIREQNVPEPDKLQMWSGVEKKFSLREPYPGNIELNDDFQDKPGDNISDEINSCMGNQKKVLPFLCSAGKNIPPYSIHVNSFTSESLAEKRVKDLSSTGCDSFVVPADVPGKGVYYRVLVGRYESFKTAREACFKLKEDSGFEKGIHVVERKWILGE